MRLSEATHYTTTKCSNPYSMCIFSGPVESVSKTKILVAPISKETQLTVYANQVHLNDNNPAAMILPFPNPTGRSDGVAMVDMTEFKDGFFKLVDRAFPEEFSWQNSDLESVGARGYSTKSLQVFDCGSYQYSVSPTYGDLDRIQSNVFHLDPSVHALLGTHYGSGYGFLVCILKKSGSYSPIAYTSPIINGKLFVPTRHEHGSSHRHQRPWLGHSMREPIYATVNAGELADDWDHDLYVLGGIERTLPALGMSRPALAAANIIDFFPSHHVITKMIGYISKEHFLKWTIKGARKNCDLAITNMFAINVETCSFPISGKEFLHQPWFNCVTCKLVNGLGCCVACATTCHKGHDLVPQSISPFFCDCRDKSSCSFAQRTSKQNQSASFVGQRAQDVQRYAFNNGIHDWRFLPEGSAVTLEYVEGRKTFYYDDQFIVVNVKHG
jgi:Putative zinc finger in N-recognin (UBR box)